MKEALRYEIALTSSFLKELKKLPKGLRSRIFKAVDEIAANPFLGVKLRGELEGRWRWRIGKYRIIYVIDEPQKRVVLLDIGLRKFIYEQ